MTDTNAAKLAEALAKAQGEFHAVEKNATNPYVGNRYADLASVLSAVRPALSKHGLALTQRARTGLVGDGGRGVVAVTTTLMHVSGESIEDTCELPVLPAPGKGERVGTGPVRPQDFGAAITYARRFSILSLLVLAAEDTDVESKGSEGAGEARRQAAAKPRTDADRAAGLSTADLEASLERTQKRLEAEPKDERAKAWAACLMAEKQRRFEQVAAA